MSVATLPSKSEQQRLLKVAALEASKLTKGDKWYAVAMKWWEDWEALDNASDPRTLGKIDNSLLFDDRLKGLKREAQENRDYVLKHQKEWSHLATWYEPLNTICGDVVERQNGAKSELVIDLHPAKFEVFNDKGEKDKELAHFEITRYDTMATLIPAVAKFVKSDPLKIQVYVRQESDQKWQLVDPKDKDDMSQTIGDALPEVGISYWQMKIKKAPAAPVKAAALKAFDKLKPEAGQVLDAKKPETEEWLEAKIASVSEDGKEVVVHFLSFESKCDATFPLDSEDLQLPYTKVPDWRTQLRVEEEVDVRLNNKWITADVAKIDRTGTKLRQTRATSPATRGFRPLKYIRSKITGTDMTAERKSMDEVEQEEKEKEPIQVSSYGLVMVYYRDSRWSPPKSLTLDLGSEDIAPTYTHTERPKRRMYAPKSDGKKPEVHGVVGLRNLGNTCFMNSALQCLSSTEVITEHFVNGPYESELNRKNPLGTGGKLAIAYGNLLKDMFSDNYSSISPAELKKAVGAAFPAFQGYAQHDAHEFMSLFIDGLHEDLNRVVKKPYTEDVESDGRPNDVVAQLSWDNFLLRNQSIFVDTMYGLMKSHLVCPECKNEATKFDAFNSWSVPIPVDERVKVVINFIGLPGEESRAVTQYVMQSKGGAVGDLIAKWVSEETGVAVEDLLIAETYNNRITSTIYKTGMERDVVDSIKRKKIADVIAFELAPLPKEIQDKRNDRIALEAKKAEEQDGEEESSAGGGYYLRREKETDFMNVQVMYKVDRGGRTWRLSENLRIPTGTTCEEVHELVWKSTKIMFSVDAANEEDSESTSKEATTEDQTEDKTKSKDKKTSKKDSKKDANKEETDEPKVLGPSDIYSIMYSRRLLPQSDKPFVKKYVGDTVDVRIKPEAMKYLKEGYMENPPQMIYTRVTVSPEEKRKGLNMGPVELHESTSLLEPKKDDETLVTLAKCFEKFRTPEVLGENDQWYCNKCKEHVCATKKMDMWKTGDILSLHLKRFKGHTFGYRREKIGEFVDYPLLLDVSDYVDGQTEGNKYELYAVSNHMGGMGGGHYTAYVRKGEDWYEMNDSATHRVKADSVITASAYVLFYKRITEDEYETKLRQQEEQEQNDDESDDEEEDDDEESDTEESEKDEKQIASY